MSRLAAAVVVGVALVLPRHHSEALVTARSVAAPGVGSPTSAATRGEEELPDAAVAYPPFHAGGAGDGGLNSSWTWAAVFAGGGLALTGTTVCVSVVHRRRDKLAQLLEPVDVLLDDTAVALDKLANTPATKGDMADLRELRRRIRQAAKGLSSLPIGTVVAAIEAYEKTALPDDFADKLNEADSRADVLDLSLRQGAGIEAVRNALDAVQNIIKPLRRK